jgi:hypothetical protein
MVNKEVKEMCTEIALSRVSIALITVFVFSIEARQPRATVDRRCSSVPTNTGTPQVRLN